MICHASQVGELGNGDLRIWPDNRCRLLAKGSNCEPAEAFHRVELPG